MRIKGTQTKKRLVSLDIFRGLCVVGMILVDYPGTWETRFRIFEHCAWQGITVADFIFPAFMFVMGVSMAFSINSQIEKGISKKSIYLKVFKRSVLLFAIGYAIELITQSTGQYFSSIRILGVLQRIGIVYLLAALLYLKTNKRYFIAANVVILFLYWAVLALIPVPGFGKPDLSVLPTIDVIPNLAAWIDHTVLGNKVFFWSKPYDPEGILSTLPVICSVSIGAIAGGFLRKSPVSIKVVKTLLAGGAAMLLVGLLWSILVALNKQLWTSSYVLVAGGASLVLLSGFYYVVEIKHVEKPFLFFRYYGYNALLSFSLAALSGGLLYKISAGGGLNLQDFLFNNLFNSWLPEIHASYVFSFVFVGLWALFFRFLFNRCVSVNL